MRANKLVSLIAVIFASIVAIAVPFTADASPSASNGNSLAITS